jgi:hypothetical protein
LARLHDADAALGADGAGAVVQECVSRQTSDHRGNAGELENTWRATAGDYYECQRSPKLSAVNHSQEGRVIDNMSDFRALDPFFRIIEQGLAEFVDGEHLFDLLADRRLVVVGRATLRRNPYRRRRSPSLR